jgi:hypothetical protein
MLRLPSPLPSGFLSSSFCCFVFLRGAPGVTVTAFLGFTRFILLLVETLDTSSRSHEKIIAERDIE